MKAINVAAMVAWVIYGLACTHAQQLQQVTHPPESGTFFLLSAEASGEGSPPYPFDPYFGVLPIYQFNGLPNQYLVGDSVEDFQALRSLQLELQSAGAMTMNGIELPPDDEGGGGGGEWTNGYPGWVFGTNDLYLSIIPESLTNSGTVALTIHNSESDTNDLVGWYVWATTNLAYCNDPWALDADNWAWVAATEPGQTNVTGAGAVRPRDVLPARASDQRLRRRRPA